MCLDQQLRQRPLILYHNTGLPQRGPQVFNFIAHFHPKQFCSQWEGLWALAYHPAFVQVESVL